MGELEAQHAYILLSTVTSKSSSSSSSLFRDSLRTPRIPLRVPSIRSTDVRGSGARGSSFEIAAVTVQMDQRASPSALSPQVNAWRSAAVAAAAAAGWELLRATAVARAWIA